MTEKTKTVTPEEAVDHCISECGCPETAELEDRAVACRDCMIQLVATAHDNETQRCNRRVAAVATLIERDILPKVISPDTKGLVESIVNTLNSLADDLLTTGGLEVET